MIYVFHGSDRDRVRSVARAQIDRFVSAKPGIIVSHFEAGADSAEQIKSLAAGTSLFGESYLISLRYFCENATGREFLLDLIPHLKGSSHDIIITDGTLTKEPLTKLEEAGAKVNKFMKVEVGGYNGAHEVKVSHPIFHGYNIYRVTDAFGTRDKKKLWVEYETALTAGLPAEELFWKITWQLKQMLVVSKITSTDKTEMKPFSIQKAKGFLRNYKPAELVTVSSRLIDIYHKARRGQTDFDTAMERFVLEI